MADCISRRRIPDFCLSGQVSQTGLNELGAVIERRISPLVDLESAPAAFIDSYIIGNVAFSCRRRLSDDLW